MTRQPWLELTTQLPPHSNRGIKGQWGENQTINSAESLPQSPCPLEFPAQRGRRRSSGYKREVAASQLAEGRGVVQSIKMAIGSIFFMVCVAVCLLQQVCQCAPLQSAGKSTILQTMYIISLSRIILGGGGAGGWLCHTRVLVMTTPPQELPPKYEISCLFLHSTSPLKRQITHFCSHLNTARNSPLAGDFYIRHNHFLICDFFF